MHTQNSASGANSSHTTTTEELIVQYLDGELVRRELETVLFDRLAHSEEARTLLREYLVMRGAIRQSHQDERFQLSNELDARTRGRIEQLFETIAVEGFDTALPLATTPGMLIADQPAITTNAATRRLKRRVFQSSLAVLALFVAVGTTWFITRTSDEHGTIHQLAQKVPVTMENQTQQATISGVPVSNVKTEDAPFRLPSHENRDLSSAPKSITRATSYASAGHTVQSIQPKAAPPSVSNSDDIMISDRFGKAIEAAGKHEVVISRQDRL